MRISSLTLSSVILTLGFLFVISSNPKLIDREFTPEECFISFFIMGISSILIYNLARSFLNN